MIETAVRERALPCAQPQVKAILSGRKTTTLRAAAAEYSTIVRLRGHSWHVDDPNAVLACPYGPAGTLLYVQEAWRVGAWDYMKQSIAVDYRADGFARTEWLYVPDMEQFERLASKSLADATAAGIHADAQDGGLYWSPGASPCRWRPGRFMPRWAAFRWLRVLDISLVRLESLTDEDARRDGFTDRCELLRWFDNRYKTTQLRAWRVEFERIEREAA